MSQRIEGGGIGIEAVERARDRLAGRLRATPLVASPALSGLAGQPVRLKLEHWQLTGSFNLDTPLN